MSSTDSSMSYTSHKFRTMRITMMRMIICRAIFVLLFITAFLNPGIYAETQETPVISPENSSWIYAYAGMGFFQWKMMSINEYLSFFGDDEKEGVDFSHEADPYIIRKYGIKTNFFLFSLGLDYFSDKFSFMTDYDTGRDLEEKNDKRSEQMKYLGGINLGNYSINLTALFRDFQSTITSRGFGDYFGGKYSIYYYTENGDMIELPAGEKVSWYTVYSEYELRIDQKSAAGIMGYGLRYKTYNSPTVVSVSYEEGNNNYDGEILMFTKNSFVELVYAFKSLSRIWGDFYLQGYVPIIYSLYYKVENSYFKRSEFMPLGISSAGNLGISYLLPNLNIQAGVDYGMYSLIMVTLDNVKINREIRFNDNIDGTLVTAPAGSTVDMDVDRLEFFWGFYVNASVYF